MEGRKEGRKMKTSILVFVFGFCSLYGRVLFYIENILRRRNDVIGMSIYMRDTLQYRNERCIADDDDDDEQRKLIGQNKH